ncbi:ABC-type transporter, integral membrane subunit [Thalassoporum mexicanum PCC 7367]|uniref:ABC transporter permease n=1 Tax=Thalassoporum mexicanum TaxID=3457544 RepID=UPI00029FA941|nr:ABC transporter permease [Pseudanabaena sp. PCC 7367]AFY69768.1 ABC-type transporter, integral membrane subunit [Pseudanabaena sp. PCC 7367]
MPQESQQPQDYSAQSTSLASSEPNLSLKMRSKLKGKLGKWQTWYVMVAFVYMYLPIAILAVLSFSPSTYQIKLDGFTLQWYVDFLQDTRLMSALVNSLTVSAVAVAIAAVLGTLMAVGLSRYYFPGKSLYLGASYLPLIMPDIAIAVATWSFFIGIAVPLSLGTVICAHIVFSLAYIAVVVSSRLAGLDPRLEEAAIDLGATPAQAFMRVLLPQLLPGIISGCLLAFVLSLDDYLIARFTIGTGDTTLPIAIFETIRRPAEASKLRALSVVLLLGSGAIALVAELIRNWGSADRA